MKMYTVILMKHDSDELLKRSVEADNLSMALSKLCEQLIESGKEGFFMPKNDDDATKPNMRVVQYNGVEYMARIMSIDEMELY